MEWRTVIQGFTSRFAAGSGMGVIFLVVFLSSVAAVAVHAQGSNKVVDPAAKLGILHAQGSELFQSGNYAEALRIAEESLALAEQLYESDDPNVAIDLNNKAQVLVAAGQRLGEAESLMRRAVEIVEKHPEDLTIARYLNNLAGLLRETNRLTEAEPLYRRALGIYEKTAPEDLTAATVANNLAELLRASNRPTEAELLYRDALTIDLKRGTEHPYVARDLNNLGLLLLRENRLEEAEPLMRRAIEIDEKRGFNHPDVAKDLSGLAGLLLEEKRLQEAEPLLQRALEIDRKNFGDQHSAVARDYNNLASLHANMGDWSKAAELHMRAVPIMTGPAAVEKDDRSGLAKSALIANTWALRNAARAFYRADARNAKARDDGFQLAQWALQTEAADATAQMAARFAKGEEPLAAVVRERQDQLVRRRGAVLRLDVATGKANAKSAENARGAIAEIDKKLDAIDVQLAHEFGPYAQLTNPKPLTIVATQALLRDDEALILFMDMPPFGKLPEETLVWLVTKTNTRWRTTFGIFDINVQVNALRCGLDKLSWVSTNWIEPAQQQELTFEERLRNLQNQPGRCKSLLGRGVSNLRDPLPFNFAAAYTLYQWLLEPFADDIVGKKLLVVTSGPLSSLPLQVLITQEPTTEYARSQDDYRDAAWLIKEHAITVLPAVTSLKSLREKSNKTEARSGDIHDVRSTADARRPFIGFGNPLVFGPFGTDSSAKNKQTCEKTTSAINEEVAKVEPGVLGPIARAYRANIKKLRPLPETAVELCEIAKTLHASESDVYLGQRATVTAVKTALLDHYRVVQFATHGLVSSETTAAEGALVLTPSATETDKDDGLLTASEVAQLKLNADWVVLSACNTAAGDKPGAEPLSGLARAFFYAGARALLVSHWSVYSAAATQITTGAFGALVREPAIGYAEAFRRSMLEVIQGRDWPKDSKIPAAHPAVWAPFALVGEGGSLAE